MRTLYTTKQAIVIHLESIVHLQYHTHSAVCHSCRSIAYARGEQIFLSSSLLKEDEIDHSSCDFSSLYGASATLECNSQLVRETT
jgi:hypothetical protein